MDIVICVNAGLVTVGDTTRKVVFPLEYLKIDTLRYNTVTTLSSVSYVDATTKDMEFTVASVLATALTLWQAAAPSVDEMWARIKERRTQANANGVLVAGDWFHTDAESLAHYAIMYSAISVNALPDGFVFNPRWKTMSGGFTPMTVAMLKRIINTGMRNTAINFAVSERHKAALKLIAAPSKYDYSTGWIKGYV